MNIKKFQQIEDFFINQGSSLECFSSFQNSITTMKIKTFQGGFDKNLSYLICCESTHISGIIDASVNLNEINDFIQN